MFVLSDGSVGTKQSERRRFVVAVHIGASRVCVAAAASAPARILHGRFGPLGALAVKVRPAPLAGWTRELFRPRDRERGLLAPDGLGRTLSGFGLALTRASAARAPLTRREPRGERRQFYRKPARAGEPGRAERRGATAADWISVRSSRASATSSRQLYSSRHHTSR